MRSVCSRWRSRCSACTPRACGPARTFTVDGVAVGEFEVEPEHGREPDWAQVAADLRAALVDPVPIREQLAARSTRYRTFTRPTAARPADPACSSTTTPPRRPRIVEVRAADGIGVLARITDVFARSQVRVEQAYVSTLGHEVVDTFYVTTPDGAKVTDPDAVAGLEGRTDRGAEPAPPSDVQLPIVASSAPACRVYRV